ncbi:FAD-dependent monooxygenase [Spirillospora sp. CA-294931]|uniref:FAD-dependent monooxygenase n=1 Tax=Spirillospora sp. CA-294931 TaxID=3240042 RepID=UPI003D8A98B6
MDRLTFRQTLAAGLDDVVHYGKRLTHYEDVPGGVVRAHFADGSSAEGDVLVGADGIGSAVRSQLLPNAQTFDTSLRLIYGRTPLTPARRELLADFAIVTGPSARSMVLGVFEFENDPRHVAGSLGLSTSFTDVGDYVMWGLVVPAEDVGEESPTGTAPGEESPTGTAVDEEPLTGTAVDEEPLTGTAVDEESPTGTATGEEPLTGSALDEESLIGAALKLTSGWHPGVHGLIEEAVPSSLTLLSLHSSIPVDAWRTRNVTLLGDAAHAMFPAGGGTAIALRDAAELRQALHTVTTGTSHLLPALATYESAMRSYSASAVRESYLMAERLGAPPWPAP